MAWPMALCGKWRCRSFPRRRGFPEPLQDGPTLDLARECPQARPGPARAPPPLNRGCRPRFRRIAHRASLQLFRAAGDRRRDSEDVRFLKSGESRGHMPLLRAFDTPCTWAAENGLTMKFVSDLTEVFPEMFCGEGNGLRGNEDSIPVAGRSRGESAIGGGPAILPARRWSGKPRRGAEAGGRFARLLWQAREGRERCDATPEPSAIHPSPFPSPSLRPGDQS